MSRSTIKRIAPWVAAGLWMVVIFLLSAQVAEDSSQTSGRIVHWVLGCLYRDFEKFSTVRQAELMALWSVIIRKGAHFTEYAVLAALIANVLRGYSLPGKLRWGLPVAASALYALTDEFHQYFVPGRACRLLDVGIDTCGAVFGTIIFWSLWRLAGKRKRRRTNDQTYSL